MPAYIITATATSRYVSRIDSTHSSPARPGTFVGSLDSSPSVRQVSQPQNAKIDPVTPITKALSASPVNGLNQSSSNSGRQARRPRPTCTRAITANTNRMVI